jgi:hypothetical protein
MRITKLTAVVVRGACLVALAAPGAAQIQRGAVYGSVHDGTGAVVPGAVLHLSSGLAASRETTSGERGEFRFPDLDPGEALRVTLSPAPPAPWHRRRCRHDVELGRGARRPFRRGDRERREPVLDSRRQGSVTN